jgi:acetyltransferase-like isoleucine patch superfamily enzyme
MIAAGFYAHPAAIVESDLIGDGTRIWAFAHVVSGARIGTDCNIGGGCFIEGGAILGNNVTVKNGVAVWDGVTVGNGVFLGPDVTLTNDQRPRAGNERFELSPTALEDGCSIGANATILSGIVIGRHALVGAGAVVTRDVPPHGLVVGNPARLVGHVCVCAATLDFSDDVAHCECGRVLTRVEGQVRIIESA